MKKRLIYLIPFLAILIVGIIFAYTSQIPNPGHGGNELLVSVDGYTMTLQEAIDNDFLVDNGPSPTKSYTSQVLTGHSENIFVSVSGNEKTIGQAISSSLCGSGSDTYNSAITLGHDASDIWVSIDGVEMTLQSAINGGEFCCVDTSWTPATSTVCSGQSFTQTSDCGNTRTVTGTKCCDTSWTPATSIVCSYLTFTQTSNCGNTRVVSGTKNCNWELYCECWVSNPAGMAKVWHKFEGGNHYTRAYSPFSPGGDSGWILGNYAKIPPMYYSYPTVASYSGGDSSGTLTGISEEGCIQTSCGDQPCESCAGGCTCTASR